MKQNPEGARRLKELVPKTTLQNWVSGTVKDPRKIRASARLKVYQLTSIETFRADDYIDPATIDLRKIFPGDQPREYLGIWLEENRISRLSLGKSAGVGEDSVRSYIRGEKLNPAVERKIAIQLERYASGLVLATQTTQAPAGEERKLSQERMIGAAVCGTSVAVPSGVLVGTQESNYPKTEQTQEGKGVLGGLVKLSLGEQLNSLACQIEGLQSELRAHGYAGELTAEQRRGIVEGAIDVLVEQMDYYRGASQQERNSLVDHLTRRGEVPRWGWVSNILGGIAKKESPETFARGYSPPEKEKR
jgi:hypothetical protein